MKIWTTHELEMLFLDGDLPLKVMSYTDIKQSFLQEASYGDLLVIPYDKGVVDYLAALKVFGIETPVVLISSGQTGFMEDAFNAIAIDVNKTGPYEVKNIVRFVFKLVRERVIEGVKHVPPHVEEEVPDVKPAEDNRPIDGDTNSKTVIEYNIKTGLPIVVSFQFTTYKEDFTARGICYASAIRGADVVLERFKPAAISGALGKGSNLFVVFSYGEQSYETILKVTDVIADRVYARIPDKLIRERRKHVRVEPARMKPIELYMMMENEPTFAMRVFDISVEGVGFYLNRDLKIGETAYYTIIMPEPRSVILCHGTVKFKKEIGATTRYGVQCLLHPSDTVKVSKYIMRRESEIIGILKSSKSSLK